MLTRCSPRSSTRPHRSRLLLWKDGDNDHNFQAILNGAEMGTNFVNDLTHNIVNNAGIFINNVGNIVSNNRPEDLDPPPRYTAQNTGPRIQVPPLPQSLTTNNRRQASLINPIPTTLINTTSENRHRARNVTREAARLNISRAVILPPQNSTAKKAVTTSRLNQRPWTLREYRSSSEILPLPPPSTPGHPSPLIYTPRTRPHTLPSLRSSRLQRAKQKFQEKFRCYQVKVNSAPYTGFSEEGVLIIWRDFSNAMRGMREGEVD